MRRDAVCDRQEHSQTSECPNESPDAAAGSIDGWDKTIENTRQCDDQWSEFN